MTVNSLKVAALAALALTAGCSKKAPKEIPPPPIGAEGSDAGEAAVEAGTPESGSVGSETLPGSRADFVASVGSDRILFETDGYAIDDEDRRVLDAQAAWLQANGAVRVTIEGHADERGTREYNLALGDRRANAVRDYLDARGVASARMQTISWGKERLENPGSDEGAHARNRRSVTVVPV